MEGKGWNSKDQKTERDGLDLTGSVKSIAVKLILQLHFKSFLMQVFKSSKGLRKEFKGTCEGISLL